MSSEPFELPTIHLHPPRDGPAGSVSWYLYRYNTNVTHHRTLTQHQMQKINEDDKMAANVNNKNKMYHKRAQSYAHYDFKTHNEQVQECQSK